MAITQTVVRAGAFGRASAVVDVGATATKDKTATVAHGLGVTPVDVYFSQLLAEAYVSRWTWTANTTNVILTKLSTAGSANAAAQLRVFITRPHTIVQ